MVIIIVTIIILLCSFNIARRFLHLDQKLDGYCRPTMPLDKGAVYLVQLLKNIYLFILAVPALRCGMQALSCGMQTSQLWHACGI